MKTIKMNISELVFPEKNVRKHPQRQIKEMKRSIGMFGQFRPVIVDENNVILAGNGLIEAMKEMSIETVDVLKYDNLSENQKKKLMIADNQISSMGVDDFTVIEEFIKSLEGDFDVPGYDTETLEMLVAESDDVTKEVMNYGLYSTEEVEAVKQNEGFEQKEVKQTFENTQNRQVIDNHNNQMAREEEMETSHAETQRYIICPHCNEKVYIE